MNKILAIAAASLLVATSATAATTIPLVNSSFEQSTGGNGINNRPFNSLAPNGGNSWEIFQTLPGWRTISGAGIEIQTDQTLSTIDAIDGEHYVELDSNNNTWMAQIVTLAVGWHELSFLYSPRTTNNATNGIQYLLGNTVLGTATGPNAGPPLTQVGLWTEITHRFYVSQAGNYDLGFRASQTSDSYGGLMDRVALAAVPVPAAGLLLLGALGGLAGMRRRKSAAAV